MQSTVIPVTHSPGSPSVHTRTRTHTHDHNVTHVLSLTVSLSLVHTRTPSQSTVCPAWATIMGFTLGELTQESTEDINPQHFSFPLSSSPVTLSLPLFLTCSFQHRSPLRLSLPLSMVTCYGMAQCPLLFSSLTEAVLKRSIVLATGSGTCDWAQMQCK